MQAQLTAKNRRTEPLLPALSSLAQAASPPGPVTLKVARLAGGSKARDEYAHVLDPETWNQLPRMVRQVTVAPMLGLLPGIALRVALFSDYSTLPTCTIPLALPVDWPCACLESCRGVFKVEGTAPGQFESTHCLCPRCHVSRDVPLPLGRISACRPGRFPG